MQEAGDRKRRRHRAGDRWGRSQSTRGRNPESQTRARGSVKVLKGIRRPKGSCRNAKDRPRRDRPPTRGGPRGRLGPVALEGDLPQGIRAIANAESNTDYALISDIGGAHVAPHSRPWYCSEDPMLITVTRTHEYALPGEHDSAR